jgi:hypothetical protein
MPRVGMYCTVCTVESKYFAVGGRCLLVFLPYYRHRWTPYSVRGWIGVNPRDRCRKARSRNDSLSGRLL